MRFLIDSNSWINAAFESAGGVLLWANIVAGSTAIATKQIANRPTRFTDFIREVIFVSSPLSESEARTRLLVAQAFLRSFLKSRARGVKK
jgi:hypothetical protein